MKKRNKVIIGVLVLGLLGLTAYRVFFKDGNKGGRQQGPVTVETAPVTTGTINLTGSFIGSLRAKAQVSVAPKVSGHLLKLHVQLGDTVRHGQLLAELDNEAQVQTVEKARADLTQAKANVEEAMANLKTATNNYNSAKTLLQKSFISQMEYDQEEASYISAKAKVSVANASVAGYEAALRNAQVQLGYTRLTADWVGGSTCMEVGAKLIEQGDMVAANAPILTLVDNSVLTADINVTEKDYALVKEGQYAGILTDAFSGKTFAARVAHVAPLMQEESRQARVEIEVPNPGGELKAGMFARVEIVYETHEKAVLVPTAAVVTQGDRIGVFLFNADGSAGFVPVQTGISREDVTEITSPELTGEVITLGNDKLKDKQKVQKSAPAGPSS